MLALTPKYASSSLRSQTASGQQIPAQGQCSSFCACFHHGKVDRAQQSRSTEPGRSGFSNPLWRKYGQNESINTLKLC
jgi:hypothetical protein